MAKQTILLCLFLGSVYSTQLSLSPPMVITNRLRDCLIYFFLDLINFTALQGWMSWEMFRCDVDCVEEPTACINEQLYESMADALSIGGFAAAGYNAIHLGFFKKLYPR